MKVLSIKEPFATLIKRGIKQIETRSWKTNYRGLLYIHSSLTKDKIKLEKLKDLYDENDLAQGYITCSCELVDCILITEEFVNNLKQNNYTEYRCGNYEVGRYAWILKNVQILDKKIAVKGKLGIWNYK